MCSVIEIKNNDEYYIRYHSPDSMDNADTKGAPPSQNAKNDKEQVVHSGSDDGTNTSSADSGHQRELSTSPKGHVADEQELNELINTNLKRQITPFGEMKKGNIDKDVDVTSDRGSSELSIDEKKQNAVKSLNTARSDKLDRSDRNVNYHSKGNDADVENVPITINSHIPATPDTLVSPKVITNDTGTQMESMLETNGSQISTGTLDETASRATNSTSVSYTHLTLPTKA